MIKLIECETCGETMGSIEKPVITAEDIELYQQSVTCSLGHGTTVLHEQEEMLTVQNMEEKRDYQGVVVEESSKRRRNMEVVLLFVALLILMFLIKSYR